MGSDVYICGYNICRYDVPLLKSALARCGFDFPVEQAKFIDLFYIIKNIEEIVESLDRLTLSNVYNYITGKDLDAHDAKNDVIACVEILRILNRKRFPWRDYVLTYLDLPGSIINDPNYTLKFGKHIGESISYLIEEKPSYLRWLDRKGLIKLSSEFTNLIYKNNE